MSEATDDKQPLPCIALGARNPESISTTPPPAIKQRIRKYKTARKMRRDPVVSASVLKTKPPCRRGRGALQIAVMWESGWAAAHTGVQPE